MSEIKIGDRVHARFPYCAGVATGTVTAIERSAGAIVYCVLVDEASEPSRTTAAWLIEVTTEPTWRQTAENLREALARVTEERDEARERVTKLETERDEVARGRDIWRDLARARYWKMQELDEQLDRARASIAKIEADLERAANVKTWLEAERDTAVRGLDGARVMTRRFGEERDAARARIAELEAERDSLYRRAAQLAELLRIDGDDEAQGEP